MAICKYFLRGTCRFGENCKNEHSYNDPSGSVMKKKQDIDPNVIIKSVSNDMDKAENGHQWPFSCYGPFQGKPCLPGFEDKSFEEIRYGFIEAEKNGTIEQYKQHLIQLLNEIRMKTRSLLNPTPEATKILQELFNLNTVGNQNVFTNSSNNLFTNNPNQPHIYGNNQSMFSNQPAPTSASNFTFTVPENKNIFGNTQINSGSIFTQNNQPGFSSNKIFGGGNSIFANAQQNFPPNTNMFQNPTNQNFPNSDSIFGQQNKQIFTQQPPTGGNIFAQNTEVNPFKQNTPFVQNIPDPPNPFKQNTEPFQQNVVDPFKPNTNPVDPFKQNIFQQVQSPDSNQSLFATANTFGHQNSILHAQVSNNQANTLEGHTNNIFGSMQTTVGYQTQLDSRRQDDTTIYSKFEDLTEKEIKQFEAASFEFGKIPVNPPTLQMC